MKTFHLSVQANRNCYRPPGISPNKSINTIHLSVQANPNLQLHVKPNSRLATVKQIPLHTFPTVNPGETQLTSSSACRSHNNPLKTSLQLNSSKSCSRRHFGMSGFTKEPVPHDFPQHGSPTPNNTENTPPQHIGAFHDEKEQDNHLQVSLQFVV